MKKLVMVILVLGVAVGGYILLNSKPDQISETERQRALAQILGRKPNTAPNIKTGESIYNGRYLTLKYPARAKIYAPKDSELLKNKYVIEAFSFDIDQPRLILNLTVVNGDPISSSVRDVSAVQFRENKSSGYSESEINADGESGLAFSKDSAPQTKAEKTGFFLVNKRVYTVSVTGSNLEDVANLFYDIVKSLTFI